MASVIAARDRRKSTLRCVLLALPILLVMATTASASPICTGGPVFYTCTNTISFDTNIPIQQTTWGPTSYNITGFNTALGTLTGINYSVTVNIDANVTVNNPYYSNGCTKPGSLVGGNCPAGSSSSTPASTVPSGPNAGGQYFTNATSSVPLNITGPSNLFSLSASATTPNQNGTVAATYDTTTTTTTYGPDTTSVSHNLPVIHTLTGCQPYIDDSYNVAGANDDNFIAGPPDTFINWSFNSGTNRCVETDSTQVTHTNSTTTTTFGQTMISNVAGSQVTSGAIASGGVGNPNWLPWEVNGNVPVSFSAQGNQGIYSGSANPGVSFTGGASVGGDFQISYSYQYEIIVPEPAEMILFGSGLLGVAFIAKRRKSAR